MIHAERQTLSESHRAEQKHKEGCLVRWITKTLPAMSKGRRNEYWAKLSANSSPEYAEKLKNEAKTLWNSMTPEQQSKIRAESKKLTGTR